MSDEQKPRMTIEAALAANRTATGAKRPKSVSRKSIARRLERLVARSIHEASLRRVT